MDEFDSTSCGGIPRSNKLAVSLWMVDYALQMASVGYSGVYLCTHKLGILYNLLELLAGVVGGASVASANTNTNFYAVLAVAGALVSTNGSRVLDLGIDSSQSNYSAAHVAAPSMTR
ncbi:glycoside hydrolase family 79 protein [Phanerochaete carnosa HHB-10118-sp]|uniref:Glycoside hydrolase family 79 protein n=1 Tax=Phanerochaete carnosa (strain HHB-10118-sp) TaxID=650164 RepID=K5VN57_PHACS|nr:glycoside hydrolase family 79 protein [Phanerochaete carnosa HHB-10118-sp]EKM48130.1 glycoside hydrolase family 79 protein [Phanerochaete carnosa HHB-10118-sp]